MLGTRNRLDVLGFCLLLAATVSGDPELHSRARYKRDGDRSGHPGPTMHVESVISLDVKPLQFRSEDAATEMEHKTHIFDQVKIRADEVLEALGHGTLDVTVRDFSYAEHYNPWKPAYADKARVKFTVEFLTHIDESATKSLEFADKLSTAVTESADFKFVSGATSTSLDAFNPCDSPFENDCDEHATCVGTRNNKWNSYFVDEVRYQHQYAAFFTCECDEGYINARTYDEVQSPMWKLQGSVCVHNNYTDDGTRIFDAVLMGLIAMCCLMLIIIIVLVVFCCKCDRRGKYEVNKVNK